MSAFALMRAALATAFVLCAVGPGSAQGSGGLRQGAAPQDGPTSRAACSQVSQHGVTFSFAGAQRCGRFANGDWWVAPSAKGGRVTVLAISPGSGNGMNGWMVNPTNPLVQAYDARVGHYSAAAEPRLPYEAKGGQSLIKAVSRPGACGNVKGHLPCLQTAVVLTVLDTPPAGGGADRFRPPYFGTFKPVIKTSALRLRPDVLPKLPAVRGAPTLAAVRDRYAGVQLDHLNSFLGRYLHPADSFDALTGEGIANYGSDLARDNNDAALRLMLDDSDAAKRPALVNYVQAGIDWYGAVKGGVTYPADGGHFVGRKIAVAFAAVVLDDADMKAVAGRKVFSEDGHVYYSSVARRPLFGKECSEKEYESARKRGSGSRDCRDPRGEIDGGDVPGESYQACCTAKAYKASSLAIRLLPGGTGVWKNEDFHSYVDRWVSFGTWTAPNSRARHLDRHGRNADAGFYASEFQEAMWRAHRKRVA